MAEVVLPVVEVAPFIGDTPETVSYRTCDYCYESIVEDIWAHKAERRFFLAQDGSRLSVCEPCLPRHFSAQPGE